MVNMGLIKVVMVPFVAIPGVPALPWALNLLEFDAETPWAPKNSILWIAKIRQGNPRGYINSLN